MRRIVLALIVAVGLSLAGCGRGGKQDVLKKAENVKTKADLESTLGKPDNVEKLAMYEAWTYKASDGSVTFHVLGDKVILENTAPKEDK